jgi:hypothetical protein
MPTTDLVVASLDASDQILAWFYVANADTSAALDVTSETYTAATAKMLTYTNIPPATTFVGVNDSFWSEKGELVDIDASGSGTSFTTSIATTPFPGALDVVSTQTQGVIAYNEFLDWGPASTTYSVDVGSRLLRQATSGTSFDAASHKVTWTEETTGLTPDLATTSFYAVLDSESSPFGIYWRIVAPYSAGEIAFPTLPVETLDYNVAVDDPVEIQQTLLVKLAGGYDGIRSRFFGIEGEQALVTGATGSFVYEGIDQAAPNVQRRAKTTQHKRGRPTWNIRRRM